MKKMFYFLIVFCLTSAASAELSTIVDPDTYDDVDINDLPLFVDYWLEKTE